ncbi:MAG: hypothetical protein HEQ35_02940 [Gloeotrichia echinulata IR180]|jgi:hypothetical protein
MDKLGKTATTIGESQSPNPSIFNQNVVFIGLMASDSIPRDLDIGRLTSSQFNSCHPYLTYSGRIYGKPDCIGYTSLFASSILL